MDGVLLCICYFPRDVLGQVWCLVVSIPDTFFTSDYM